MTYRPRNDLLLVEKMPSEETATTASGLIVPKGNLENVLTRLKVLSVGDAVKDVKPGDVILAENMFQKITKSDDKLGLINSKYVHLIEENNV